MIQRNQIGGTSAAKKQMKTLGMRTESASGFNPK